MPAQTLTADAFVLEKRPAASDGWFILTLISEEHGSLIARQRVPKRAAGSQILLDLFDEASIILESSNQGRTWFVREVRLIARHSALGRSYAALQAASAFAQLLARNPVAPESRQPVFALLRAAFAAFAQSGRPDIVAFKSLYCFARDEGYPVKQEWFAGLNPEDRTAAAALLNRPLAEQTAVPEAVIRLQRHLETYLRAHTEIALD
jgi:hypothetical protein